MITTCRKFLSIFVLLSFCLNTLGPAYAQGQSVLSLPAVGEKVSLSPAFSPLLLKAVKVNPDNPFQFNFIVDVGNSNVKGEELKTQAQKLIRYFLASLTTPENDLWVNLSPNEKQRIIPKSFGATEMGRDLLGQDYLLKQITASLLYPEGKIGKEFWDKVKADAFKRLGTTDIATDAFHKVWIVAQKAVVYENGTSAYVDETHLRVMLQEQYVADAENGRDPFLQKADVNTIGSQALRQIIIPEIEKEVNEGKNFAPLRQIYNSLVLANWYKKRLKDSILSQLYVDKNKIAGIDLGDKEQAQRIYNQYVEAFKKGVYNYIKEDYDPVTQETVPRKYFSGGMGLATSSAATQYRQGLPQKAGVASSQLHEIAVDLDFSNGQSPVKKASSSPAVEMLLNPNDLTQARVLEVLHTQYDFDLMYRRVTLSIQLSDGKTRILKFYSHKKNFDNESLGYAVAQKLGMHVPKHQEFESTSDFDRLVKQAVDGKSISERFKGSYGWARLIEPVEEYQSDSGHSGLEELVVFTYLMRFEDYAGLQADHGFSQNIYVARDKKFIVYDYETAWESVDSNMRFFAYRHVADKIDLVRLQNAIKKARELTADDFQGLLAGQEIREIFENRVRNFEIDMMKDLGYFADSPQAVRLLAIVKGMQSSSAVGGIDLTAAKTQLDTRRQGQPAALRFDPQQLQNLQFDGLLPVIIHIAPVDNLASFLMEKSVLKSAGPLSQ